MREEGEGSKETGSGLEKLWRCGNWGAWASRGDEGWEKFSARSKCLRNAFRRRRGHDAGLTEHGDSPLMGLRVRSGSWFGGFRGIDRRTGVPAVLGPSRVDEVHKTKLEAQLRSGVWEALS